MIAAALVFALLVPSTPASAYPPPGQTITVYHDDCTVRYQQGNAAGAYAKFDPVSWANCVWGETRVTVAGVKGGILKYKTCFLGGPCADGSWWRAQHLSGVVFAFADLRLCYPFYGGDVCRTYHFTT